MKTSIEEAGPSDYRLATGGGATTGFGLYEGEIENDPDGSPLSECSSRRGMDAVLEAPAPYDDRSRSGERVFETSRDRSLK